MSWCVVVRPEVAGDVNDAADWYDQQQDRLGSDLCEEVILVLEALAENPLINSRRHQTKNVRWRYTKRFPYRVVDEVIESENTVVVAAVLHAARQDKHWRRRA